MKSKKYLLILAVLILTACSGKSGDGVIKADMDLESGGGADFFYGNDDTNSKYFKNVDFYNKTSDNELIILPKFKTYQQTGESFSGPASVLMILNHFGIEGYTEYSAAKEMHSSIASDIPDGEPGSATRFYDYGTSPEEMVMFFEGIDGLKVIETSYRAEYTEDDLIKDDGYRSSSDAGNLPPTFSEMSMFSEVNVDNPEVEVDDARDSYFYKWVANNINNGNCILFEWSEWDGVWAVIIGYDTNGTPSIADDMLIIANTYDVGDHCQDGYTAYPVMRWFYNWNDRYHASKPYQLQQYLIIALDK